MFWIGFYGTLQFLIIITFAVIGFVIGGAIDPGNRWAEGLCAIPLIAAGFWVARQVTGWLLLGLGVKAPQHSAQTPSQHIASRQTQRQLEVSARGH